MQNSLQFNHSSSESAAQHMKNIWFWSDKCPAICSGCEGRIVRKRLWGEKGVLGKRKNVKWTLVRSALPALRSSAAIVGSSSGAFFPFFFCQSAMWPLTLSLCMWAVFIGRVPLNQQCSLSHFFPLENDKERGSTTLFFFSPLHLHHPYFPASPPPGLPDLCKPYIQRHADTLQSRTHTHAQTCNTWKPYWEQVKHTVKTWCSSKIWSGNNSTESWVGFLNDIHCTFMRANICQIPRGVFD